MSSPTAPRRSLRNTSAKKNTARSVSPSARKAEAAATAAPSSAVKRRGRPPKAKPATMVAEHEEEEEEEEVEVKVAPKPRTTRAATKQKAPSPKPVEESESENSEEEENQAFEDELNEEFNLFLADKYADVSVKQKVLRVQYIQAYILGFALLYSSFNTSGAVFFQPFFHGTSQLVQAFCAVLALAQALSLTAIAQTTASPMKKALQYNMFFHLILALVSIIHAKEGEQQVSAQWIVVGAVLNIGLNMWACYFHENADEGRLVEIDSEDEEEESGSEEEEEEEHQD